MIGVQRFGVLATRTTTYQIGCVYHSEVLHRASHSRATSQRDPDPASHSHSEVLRRASHSRATWPVTSRSASSPTGRNGRPAVVAVVATACDTAPWKVSRTLSAAVADGPARRAASRASCCTQRWMRSQCDKHAGRTSTVASVVNLVRPVYHTHSPLLSNLSDPYTVGCDDRYAEVKLSNYRVWDICLQCFDAVGWASGRASGL